MTQATLKDNLDELYRQRNESEDFTHPDPIIIARKHRDSKHADITALFCALFAYGNAHQILKFLRKVESLTNAFDWESVPRDLSAPKYRFANQHDVANLIFVLRDVALEGSLKTTATNAYAVKSNIMDVVYAMQKLLYSRLHAYSKISFGLKHLLLTQESTGAFKRWHLFLRWMVRSDNIDLGLWSEINPKDLLLPLDTHTFRICRELGILNSKNGNIKSVIEATAKLREFCKDDPVKYDFALYRASQLRKK